MNSTRYDRIGASFTKTREADPRIVELIAEALSIKSPATILDIGAGTGNYAFALAELGYAVTALEPSEIMQAQARPHPQISWKFGVAENLSFETGSFDAALMILSAHHFNDLSLALREALRVTRGPLVMFTFDPDVDPDFWLFNYFPAFRSQMRQTFPSLNELAEISDYRMEVRRFPLPGDLRDRFAASGWNRPEIYQDPVVRAGISSFALTDQKQVQEGINQLKADLESGSWDARFGKLREEDRYDAGYVCLRFSRDEFVRELDCR